MATKIDMNVIARPLEEFITDAMRQSATAQTVKLIAAGHTPEAAAAEAAAWIAVKAKSARIFASMGR